MPRLFTGYSAPAWWGREEIQEIFRKGRCWEAPACLGAPSLSCAGPAGCCWCFFIFNLWLCPKKGCLGSAAGPQSMTGVSWWGWHEASERAHPSECPLAFKSLQHFFFILRERWLYFAHFWTTNIQSKSPQDCKIGLVGNVQCFLI